MIGRAKKVLYAYGLLVGFVSDLFMVYVFLNEAFLGKAVLYYEPNVLIATVEFYMAALAAVVGCAQVFAYAIRAAEREPSVHGLRDELRGLQERIGSLEADDAPDGYGSGPNGDGAPARMWT